MKKFFYLLRISFWTSAILLLMALSIIFGEVLQVNAQGTTIKVEPKTTTIGYPVSVTAATTLISSAGSITFGSSPPNLFARINYGDGTFDLLECSWELQPWGPSSHVWKGVCYGQFSHTYTAPGNYDIRLERTQVTGISGSISAVTLTEETVTILPEPTQTTSVITNINPLAATNIADVIRIVGNGIVIFGGAGAFLMILIGGYYFLFSGGDPVKVAKGKRIILISFIGLAILILARGIIFFVEKLFRG